MLYLFILLIPRGEVTSFPTRSLVYVMYIVNIYIMYPETGNICIQNFMYYLIPF